MTDVSNIKELTLQACNDSLDGDGEFNASEVWNEEVFDSLVLEGEDLFYLVNDAISDLESDGVIEAVDGSWYRFV